ncbi:MULTISPECIES: cytochrome c maturation protein CcmE [Ahrensia]|uniref:cytochrome c maturation protein CcmE n=1 Tax=Ahrensia TaxID=152180 RepID=UPI0004770834|nr:MULTISPECIES: cytochrome c maturation protein CcmE [Ahrensia]
MTRKQKRSIVIFGALGTLAVAVALVLTALSEQVTFFRTPSDLVNVIPNESSRVRLGGVVVEGSVDSSSGDGVTFAVEDANAALKVRYAGILPDLFREGQGIVAEGIMGPDGTFSADTVLAKHDETYMPREVADSLKEQGYWKGDETQ